MADSNIGDSFISSDYSAMSNDSGVGFHLNVLTIPSAKEPKKYTLKNLTPERKTVSGVQYRLESVAELPSQGIGTICAEFACGRKLNLPSVAYDITSDINAARAANSSSFTTQIDFNEQCSRTVHDPLKVVLTMHGKIDNNINSVFKLDGAELHVKLSGNGSVANKFVGNSASSSSEWLHPTCTGDDDEEEHLQTSGGEHAVKFAKTDAELVSCTVNRIVRKYISRSSPQDLAEVVTVNKSVEGGACMMYRNRLDGRTLATNYESEKTFNAYYDTIGTCKTTIPYYSVAHLSHVIICTSILNLIRSAEKYCNTERPGTIPMFSAQMLYQSEATARLLQQDVRLLEILRRIYSGKLPRIIDLIRHESGLPASLDMTKDEIAEFITTSTPIKAKFVNLEVLFFKRMESVNLISPIGVRVTPSALGTRILAFILRSMVALCAPDELKQRPSIERAMCWCLYKIYGITHARFGGTSILKWEQRPLILSAGVITTVEEKDFVISNDSSTNIEMDVEKLFVFPYNIQLSIYDLGRFLYRSWQVQRDEIVFFTGRDRTVGLDADLSLFSVNAITDSGLYYGTSSGTGDVLYCVGVSGPGSIGCTTVMMYLPWNRVAIAMATNHPHSKVVRDCALEIAKATSELLEHAVVKIDMLPGQFSLGYEQYRDECSGNQGRHTQLKTNSAYAVGFELSQRVMPNNIPNRFYSLQTTEFSRPDNTDPSEIMCCLDLVGNSIEASTDTMTINMNHHHFLIRRSDIIISTPGYLKPAAATTTTTLPPLPAPLSTTPTIVTTTPPTPTSTPTTAALPPPLTTTPSSTPEIKPITIVDIGKTVLQTRQVKIAFNKSKNMFFELGPDSCFVQPFSIHRIPLGSEAFYSIAYNGRVYMEGDLFNAVFSRLIKSIREIGTQPFAGTSGIYGGAMSWFTNYLASNEI